MEPDGRTAVNLRRGVLQYCILAILRDGDWYGHILARHLNELGLLDSEGTLYPLLARLRRTGLVETTWRESTSGPPRRYYKVTDTGHVELSEFAAEWKQLGTVVNGILNGDRR
ncbi:PadR family transcriptional regulator [Microbacterium sp. STN6]|uniref:PadR family transcriptional regulator n=1 Tax=Microbacterium sp. STN6 TaxID=2995588 RepID=UPI002260E24C|nr:PadR family transcriptional regulator [Microbacterium sp. STN6]MCX7521645.1 PadR family transcriptional regulator [Microbacterium sp. STN6]